MTIEEKVFLPQIMKLESDIYLQNNGDKKKTSVYAITKTPGNKRQIERRTFNVEGLITSARIVLDKNFLC
jgi:hypothetical protein